MLIGCIGDVRTGKTLLLTKFAYQLANIPENRDSGFQVFSNFHIADKRIKFITVNDFVDLHLDELNSGLVVLQEFYTWLFSKLGNSEINRGLTPVIAQSGKAGFDIMWDAQLSSLMAPVVRLLTEHFWVARPKLYKREKKYHPTLIAFRYVFVTNRIMLRFTLPVEVKGKDGINHEVAKRYFSLYDTREQASMLYQGRGTSLQQADVNQRIQQQILANKVAQQTVQMSPIVDPEVPRKSPVQDLINLQEQPFNTVSPITSIPSKYGRNKALTDEVITQMEAEGKIQDLTLE